MKMLHVQSRTLHGNICNGEQTTQIREIPHNLTRLITLIQVDYNAYGFIQILYQPISPNVV